MMDGLDVTDDIHSAGVCFIQYDDWKMGHHCSLSRKIKSDVGLFCLKADHMQLTI